MNHLSDNELVDALDGTLQAGPAVHARDCAVCQDRLADLAHALASAREAAIPDPSPLFWDHLSARVRAAIADQPRPAQRWLAWPVLVPFGGLALLVVALVSGIVRHELPRQPESLSADAVRLETEDAVEAAWALTANLMGTAPTSVETDVPVRPGSAEYAALQLTPAEQTELVRLLREELKAGG